MQIEVNSCHQKECNTLTLRTITIKIEMESTITVSLKRITEIHLIVITNFDLIFNSQHTFEFKDRSIHQPYADRIP